MIKAKLKNKIKDSKKTNIYSIEFIKIKNESANIKYKYQSVYKGNVEEYIAHPNDLKNLKVGQAYVKILLPNSKQYIDKIEFMNKKSI